MSSLYSLLDHLDFQKSRGEIRKLVTLVEENFEDFSLRSSTLAEIIQTISCFSDMIFVTITLVAFVFYVFSSNKDVNILIGLVAVYFAFMSVLYTSANKREEKLKELELTHNMRILEARWSGDTPFQDQYPFIKSLILLKQKDSKINLVRLSESWHSILSRESLIEFLYDQS